VNFRVHIGSVRNCAADLLSHKSSVLFPQPVDQRLERANAHFQLSSSFFIGGKALRMDGVQESSQRLEGSSFPLGNVSRLSRFKASPIKVIAHRASKIFSGVSSSIGSNP